MQTAETANAKSVGVNVPNARQQQNVYYQTTHSHLVAGAVSSLVLRLVGLHVPYHSDDVTHLMALHNYD
jgi:hypothetical protein